MKNNMPKSLSESNHNCWRCDKNVPQAPANNPHSNFSLGRSNQSYGMLCYGEKCCFNISNNHSNPRHFDLTISCHFWEMKNNMPMPLLESNHNCWRCDKNVPQAPANNPGSNFSLGKSYQSYGKLCYGENGYFNISNNHTNPLHFDLTISCHIWENGEQYAKDIIRLKA